MNEAPFPEPTPELIEEIEKMYGLIPEPPITNDRARD